MPTVPRYNTPLPVTGGGGGGGGAATIADGADVAQGFTTDAIVAAGAVGTLSSKMRRVTQGLEDLKTLTVLAAGTNVIGKTGIDQTTPGTTNAVAAKAIYEAAPTVLTDGQRGELLLTNARELRTYPRAMSTGIDSMLVGPVAGSIFKVWAQLYDGVSNTAIGAFQPNTSSSAGENVCTVNYKNLVGVASATVSASPATATLDVSRFSELILFIKTGAVVGAGTLTFTLQTLSPDGTYYPIWTSTAIGATTTLKVSLGRGLPGTVPTAASGVSGEYGCTIGQQIQLVIALAGTSVVCGYGLMAKM